MKTFYLLGFTSCVWLLVACGKKTAETKPQRKDMIELVFASGSLEADDQYNLTAQTDGYLVKLDFVEGDAVREGQVLAVIDNRQNKINAQSAAELHRIAQRNAEASSPTLLQITANIEAAKAKLKLDQGQSERYKRLFDNNSVSNLEYENARLSATSSLASLHALQEQYSSQQSSARQQEISQRVVRDVNQVIKEQNRIKVIRSGKVYQKEKQLGDYVRKGDVIAVIGNPDLVYAKLNVDETSMTKLKPGLAVIVQLNTNKSKTYKAIVREILPAFDTGSQSFIVKVYFADKLDFRITGTQLEANIITGEVKNALVIPRPYLNYGDQVTLKKGNQQVVVKTGIISSDWVEILGGITQQDVLLSN
ncbi:efflux RND transporter periplasmic adaptor subunit [Spirosoma flavum]|uniref:Efflux RND transporter periplasmic adaptor subunit n=1 Tax=Spirosoma flavum TaxID=2048557 RepID=A0ABW6AL12_9BACT